MPSPSAIGGGAAVCDYASRGLNLTRCGSRLCIAPSTCVGRAAIVVYRDHSRWQARSLFWPTWTMHKEGSGGEQSAIVSVNRNAAPEPADQFLAVNEVRFLAFRIRSNARRFGPRTSFPSHCTAPAASEYHEARILWGPVGGVPGDVGFAEVVLTLSRQYYARSLIADDLLFKQRSRGLQGC